MCDAEILQSTYDSRIWFPAVTFIMIIIRDAGIEG